MEIDGKNQVVALVAHIKELENRLASLKQEAAQQSEMLKDSDKYIEQLMNSIETLEREKWSYESELENRRGY